MAAFMNTQPGQHKESSTTSSQHTTSADVPTTANAIQIKQKNTTVHQGIQRLLWIQPHIKHYCKGSRQPTCRQRWRGLCWYLSGSCGALAKDESKTYLLPSPFEEREGSKRAADTTRHIVPSMSKIRCDQKTTQICRDTLGSPPTLQEE